MANLPLPGTSTDASSPRAHHQAHQRRLHVRLRLPPGWRHRGTLTSVLGLDASGGRALLTTGNSTATRRPVHHRRDRHLPHGVRAVGHRGVVTNNVGTASTSTSACATRVTRRRYFTQAGGSANGVRCRYAGDATTGQAPTPTVINSARQPEQEISFLLLPKLKHAYYLEDDRSARLGLSANSPWVSSPVV